MSVRYNKRSWLERYGVLSYNYLEGRLIGGYWKNDNVMRSVHGSTEELIVKNLYAIIKNEIYNKCIR